MASRDEPYGKDDGKEERREDRRVEECGGECFEIVGRIANWGLDVQIVSISETTQGASDGVPIENTTVAVPPANASRPLLIALAEYFGVDLAVGTEPSGEHRVLPGVCDGAVLLRCSRPR